MKTMAIEENAAVEGEYKVKRNKIADHIAKVLAVITAVFIWLYAVGTDTRIEEKVFTSNEIEITGVASQLSVIYGNGETADVTIAGRYSDVNAMRKSDIHAYVDASGITQAGQYNLPVSVKLDNGITLSSVYPEQITVYVSVNQKKQIPIQVKPTDYQIPDGCTLSAVVKGAGYITVEGPIDVLENISYAGAQIAPGKISDSVTIVAPVSLYSENGTVFTSPYVTMSANEVTVKATVLLEKEIPIVVQSANGFYNEHNTEITVDPPSITVRGDVSYVSTLKEIVATTVDETQITSDTVIYVAISLPEGVENVSGYESATVKIKHTGSVTKDFLIGAENIVINNAPEGKIYQLAEEFLTVTVRMDKNSSYSAFMTAEDISVTLDFSAYSDANGRYNVPAQVIVKSNGDAVYKVGSYYMPVVFS